jgi:hypothetical protein
MEDQISEMQRQLCNVLDRESIRELVVVYCHYVRTKNIDGILALFSKDASFDLPSNMAATNASGGLLRGKAAVAEMYRSNLQEMDPWPFTHNHVVELLGDGRAKGYVYAEFRMGFKSLQVTQLGVYEDEYVKDDGGAWKFRSRKLTATPIS